MTCRNLIVIYCFFLLLLNFKTIEPVHTSYWHYIMEMIDLTTAGICNDIAAVVRQRMHVKCVHGRPCHVLYLMYVGSNSRLS